MSMPTIISGPAFVQHNSYTFYTQGDIRLNYATELWNPRAAHAGDLGPRLKSKVVRIAFTPAGMVTAATWAKYWAYGPTSIGASIMNGTVVILPMTGNKITFHRGGIIKPPGVKLSALGTIWKDMEFLCLGDITTTPTNAAYFQTIAPTAADTTFDETKVISPRYTAGYTGRESTVYSGIEPDDEGFDIDLLQQVKLMSLANFGVVDARLESLGLEVMFKPLNHTEAEMATAFGLQNADAIQPGDTVGQATDLVISGTGLTFTGKKMGIGESGLAYGVAAWRQGAVKFFNKLYTTAGVVQPLWVIT